MVRITQLVAFLSLLFAQCAGTHTPGTENLRSPGCPIDFPYMSATSPAVGFCFNTPEDATAGSGACDSWCTNEPGIGLPGCSEVPDYPLSCRTPDLCWDLDKKTCRSKRAKRWLGCRWDTGLDFCTAKSVDRYEAQPTPLVCVGPCCTLNRWTCRAGKGVRARAWAREHGYKVKKMCQFRTDKSMQTKTPDGKHYGQCLVKKSSPYWTTTCTDNPNFYPRYSHKNNPPQCQLWGAVPYEYEDQESYDCEKFSDYYADDYPKHVTKFEKELIANCPMACRVAECSP